MTNLAKLLFSFNGRISRGPFWLGVVITTAAWFGGGYLIQPEYFNFRATAPIPTTMALNIWFLLMLVPTMAVTVKRCNDRGWPSLVPASLFVLLLTAEIAEFYGHDFNAGFSFAASPVLTAYSFLISFVTLIYLIDNGFLRGTDGPNQHGDEPRNGSVAAGAALSA